MAMLYDIYAAHGAGFDREVTLRDPIEAGEVAVNINWDGHRYTSERDPKNPGKFIWVEPGEGWR